MVDEIKRDLPFEMKEHFTENHPKIKNIHVFVRKLGNYEATRTNVKAKNKSSYNVEDESYNLKKRNKSEIKCFNLTVMAT